MVYLATRGSRGASADVLDDALWPEGISFSSRRVAISKVRRWLGEGPNGELWLPPNLGADRVYRIADGHLLDWHLFRRLRTRGETRGTTGTTDLRRALELIRGDPSTAPTDHTHPANETPTAGYPPATSNPTT